MKIQRKLKRKNTNRKTHVKQNPSGLRSKTESQNELINPADLPPHILDKIPPGLSMKPNAATIRQIAMQQMTRNMMPLPFNLTPQQQQVQNMRSNNDLKENAINQAKQDMINESERKRSLQKQEADAKRENQQRKHDIEIERQQFDQEQKLKEQKHKLKRDKDDLEFQKLLIDRDNTIREQRIKNDEQLDLIRQAKLRGEELKAQAEENDLKRQLKDLEYQKDLIESNNNISEQRIKNEEQLALIQQMKYENEKLKSKLARNDLNNRFAQYQNQYNDIKTENEALIKTIDKLDSEDFQKEYAALVNNLSEARARNRVLNTLNEQRKKLIDEELMRKIEPTDEQMKKMYEQNKKDIEGLQASLAKQSDDKQNRMDRIDRFNNLRKYKNNLVIENDNLGNEIHALSERIKGFKLNGEELKKIVSEKVKAEMTLDIEKEKVEHQQETKGIMEDLFAAQEKQNILNSKEYGERMKEIALWRVRNEHLRAERDYINESSKYQGEAQRVKLDNEARQIAHNAITEGKDAIEALEDELSTNLTPQESTALFKQIAAQSQLINQHETEKMTLVNTMLQLLDSVGDKGELFRAFLKDKNSGAEDLRQVLLDANLETVKDIWNDYITWSPPEE